MNCPNCSEPRMRTVETFSMPEKTIRTKKCRSCGWTFTSQEEICDDVTVPNSVRRVKRKNTGETRMSTPIPSLTIAGQIDVLLRSATNFAAQLAVENEKLKANAARWVAFRDATVHDDSVFQKTFLDEINTPALTEDIFDAAADAAIKATS